MSTSSAAPTTPNPSPNQHSHSSFEEYNYHYSPPTLITRPPGHHGSSSSFSYMSNRMRVRFPQLQELEKKVAQPDRTPQGSYSDFAAEGEHSSISSTGGGTYEERREEKDVSNNNNNVGEVEDLEEEDMAVPSTSSKQEVTASEEETRPTPPREMIKKPKYSSPPPPPRPVSRSKKDVVQFPSLHQVPSSTNATGFPSDENLIQSDMFQTRRQPSSSRRTSRHSVSKKQVHFDPSTVHSRTFSMDCTPGRCSIVSSATPSATASRTPSLIRDRHFPHLESVLTELKEKRMAFDRASAITALKGRIMRGEKVTYEEIFALKRLSLPIHQRHFGWRLPWSMDLYCDKGLVHVPTPNKPMPDRPNSFGTMEDLRIPLYEEDGVKDEHYGRRRYHLNLAGFRDDEISLYLEGKNKLVVRAVREHDPETGTKKNPPIIATETVLLPPDLPPDNLRIARKPSGTTIIEESWRF